MILLPSPRSCAGHSCATCPNLYICDSARAIAQAECASRNCPKRFLPNQCLCRPLLPVIEQAINQLQERSLQ